MKLIVCDPNQYGRPIVFDCKSKKDIEKVLTKNNFTEDNFGGETVRYVYVDKTGETIVDSLDFT
jgi:hypothetical protein